MEAFMNEMRQVLNDEQYEAATTIDGPLLIIAGAGTGKTNTLMWRTAYLIKNGVYAETILLLTFTNKAANEIIGRVKKHCGESAKDICGGTYHSYAADMLYIYADRIGMPKEFTIIDSSDVGDAIDYVKEKCGIGKQKGFPKKNVIASILSSCVNNELTIDYIVEHFNPDCKDYLSELKMIQREYQKYKKEHGLMDFDDLLINFEKLLNENEDIARKLSAKCKYIMVDEYQDTNIIQYRILKRLRSFGNCNICVVGDDQQSIYRFRGARVKNILEFPKNFPGCKTVILKRNYRSNQEILDLANGIIDNAVAKFTKGLQGLRKSGKKPVLLVETSEYDETNDVVNIITHAIKSGVPKNEIAVLAKNSVTPNMVEAKLVANRIPYVKYGGIKFFDRVFVKDIFAFLKLSINASDSLAWFRVLQLYNGIGATYAKRITEAVVSSGTEELCDKKYKRTKYGESLAELYEIVTRLRFLSLDEQLHYLIDEYYFDLIEKNLESGNMKDSARCAGLEENEQNRKSAQVLKDIAKGYKSTAKFLAELTLEKPDTDDGDDKVVISTIHSIKGMEFDTVALMGCAEGLLPWSHKPQVNTPEAIEAAFEEIEEERRCLYVAVTRAKEHLFVSYPALYISNWRGDGGESRFLSENGLKDKYFDIVKR